jgi:hypothetical protein
MQASTSTGRIDLVDSSFLLSFLRFFLPSASELFEKAFDERCKLKKRE